MRDDFTKLVTVADDAHQQRNLQANQDSQNNHDEIQEDLKTLSEGKGEMTLGSAIPPGRLPYLHPDLPLEAALRYVHETPLVPVVSRADFRKLEGIISSQAVLNKYKPE